MPRNARVVVPELPYHVTQRGTNQQDVFETIGDRKLYLRLVRENQHEAGVSVLAYCLMTNHVHWVVVPKHEDSLAVLFGRVHGRYAQATNIQAGRSGHLWQSRFRSCPMSGSHVWVGLRYVEENPVRAGMASDAESYRWSSAAVHRKGERDRSGILDLDYWGRAGREQTWAEMYAAQGYEERIRELRQCTYAGRPFGEEEFVARLEEQLGRKWRRPGGPSRRKVANSC